MKYILKGNGDDLKMKFYYMQNGSDQNAFFPLDNGKWSTRSFMETYPDGVDFYGDGLYTFVYDEDDFDRVIKGDVAQGISPAAHLWSLEHHPEVGGYILDSDPNENLYNMDGTYYGESTYIISAQEASCSFVSEPEPGVVYDNSADKVYYNGNFKIPVYTDGGEKVMEVDAPNCTWYISLEDYETTFGPYFTYSEHAIEIDAEIRAVENMGFMQYRNFFHPISSGGYLVIMFNPEYIGGARIWLDPVG